MSLENLPTPEEEGWNESRAPYHIFSIKTTKKHGDLSTSFKDGHVYFLPDVPFFEFQILFRSNQQHQTSFNNLILNTSIINDNKQELDDNLLRERIDTSLRIYYKEIDFRNEKTLKEKKYLIINKTTSILNQLGSLFVSAENEPFSILNFNIANCNNMGCLVTIQLENREEIYNKDYSGFNKCFIYELGIELFGNSFELTRIVPTKTLYANSYDFPCSMWYLEKSNYGLNTDREKSHTRPYSHILLLKYLSVLYSNYGLVMAMNFNRRTSDEIFKRMNNLYFLSQECLTMKKLMTSCDKNLVNPFESLEIQISRPLPPYYNSVTLYFIGRVQSRCKSHMDYRLSNSDTKFPFKKECDGKLFDIFQNLCIGEFESNRNSILGIYHCLMYCLKREKQDTNEKDVFNSIKQKIHSAIFNDSGGQQSSVNLFTDFDNSLLYCLKKMSKIRISVESDCDPKTLQIISNLIEYPFKSTTALDLNDDELLNIDERYMVRSLNYFTRFKHFLNAVYFKKTKLKNYSRILIILDFLTCSIETVILSLVFMKETGSGNPRTKLNLFCLAENMIVYIEEIVRSVLSVVEIMEIEEKLYLDEPYMEKVVLQILKGLTDEEISSFIHDLCIQCSRFQGGRSVACFSTISNIAALLEEVRIK